MIITILLVILIRNDNQGGAERGRGRVAVSNLRCRGEVPGKTKRGGNETETEGKKHINQNNQAKHNMNLNVIPPLCILPRFELERLRNETIVGGDCDDDDERAQKDREALPLLLLLVVVVVVVFILISI